jgi:hypothetical protein
MIVVFVMIVMYMGCNGGGRCALPLDCNSLYPTQKCDNQVPGQKGDNQLQSIID